MLFSHSHIQLFATPWTAAHQAPLSLTISQSLPKFIPIASVMPSSLLILWYPLLFLPSIFRSIRDFSNKSTLRIRWPKYWSFSFSISPSNEYSLVWFPCCPRDSQESSPAPQFKGINSLALCLLHGPTLTTVCDHWEDHSLDYIISNKWQPILPVLNLQPGASDGKESACSAGDPDFIPGSGRSPGDRNGYPL